MRVVPIATCLCLTPGAPAHEAEDDAEGENDDDFFEEEEEQEQDEDEGEEDDEFFAPEVEDLDEHAPPLAGAHTLKGDTTTLNSNHYI